MKKLFRLNMNQDPMATEKLSEGIRLFIQDQEKLQTLLQGFFLSHELIILFYYPLKQRSSLESA